MRRAQGHGKVPARNNNGASHLSSGGYDIVSRLEVGDDPRKAPIYHGAVALLKAVSYLESRPEVDKNRIGMCGSSWGGFYTTLIVGLDPRIKAGASMFGCGYLDLGNGWWGMPGGAKFKPSQQVQQWLSTFDPGPRLKGIKTPVAWFTGTNDMFYYMPSVMASFEAAAGPKHLALAPNWAHALPAGIEAQVFAFMDIYLKKDAPEYLKVTRLQVARAGSTIGASWRFTGEREAASAGVILSFGDEGNWDHRPWKTLPAAVQVRLAGAFDGVPARQEASAAVGTGWTAFTMDFTPPRASLADLSAIVIVPKDARILVDGVSFKPR